MAIRASAKARNNKMGNSKEKLVAQPCFASPKPTNAYMEQFVVSDCCQFDSIVEKISRFINSTHDDGSLKSGARRIFDLSSLGRGFTKSLEEVSAYAITKSQQNRNQRAFPIDDPVVLFPKLVWAAPLSSHSNGHTCGPIHRDTNEEAKCGTIFSVLLFVDDVTEKNGAIKVWIGSENRKLQSKNPGRSVANLNARLLTGKSGTMCVCDCRLLHQSLPNSTTTGRRVVTWDLASNEVADDLIDTTFNRL